MAVYDSIAAQYKKASELPNRLHTIDYTYFNLLGDIAGKSILDLACGEGFYTRKLKLLGAARVVGVDISEKMLSLLDSAKFFRRISLEIHKPKETEVEKKTLPQASPQECYILVELFSDWTVQIFRGMPLEIHRPKGTEVGQKNTPAARSQECSILVELFRINQ